MLHDTAWNLILIDHSRAFGVESELVQQDERGSTKPTGPGLSGLTRKQLDAALGPWLDDRRDQRHPGPPRANEGRNQVATEIGARRELKRWILQSGR